MLEPLAGFLVVRLAYPGRIRPEVQWVPAFPLKDLRGGRLSCAFDRGNPRVLSFFVFLALT